MLSRRARIGSYPPIAVRSTLRHSTYSKFSNTEAINPAEFYPTLLDASERMFDGEIDWQQFEEVARFMFGTKAYVVFTIDLFASRVIKQVGDPHIFQLATDLGIGTTHTR